MNRIVVICACETMYGGLHGMNDVKVEEMGENELEYACECGQIMAEGVISSYSLEEEYEEEDMENGGDYQLYRQKDDSTLTLAEAEQMVNDYGFDVTEHEEFDTHFIAWA